MATLDGALVVEVAAGVAGAMAGMLLADHGARVIKVEPAGGSPERRQFGHRVWDRGKESLILALGEPADRAALGCLLGRADVLLHSCTMSQARALGFDGEACQRLSPHLVTCAITGYGPAGPLADRAWHESLVSARMGRAWGQYGWQPGPSHVALPVLSVGAALLAVQGIAAALLARATTGVGQHVDTSLFAAAFAMSTPVVGGKLSEEERAWSRRPVGPSPFYAAFACADGRWLHFGCIHAEFVRRAIEALGIAEAVKPLADDPEFGDGMRIRSDRLRDALFEIVERAVRTRPYDEWARLLEAADVPIALVRWPHEYLDDPQAQVNGVVEVRDTEVGRIRQIGPALRLSETPGRVRGPAPRLGEHTRALMAELGGTRAHPSVAAAPGEARPVTSPPLDGLRVLEIASLIAGPMAGRFLADLGADVVKLEPSDGGDIARRNGSPAFLPLNAGKRGVAVNLKLPEGRDVGHRLARWADVVIDNMRPGAAERLGMGWDELRVLNPRLIYCHVTAYGSRGPYAHRPGLDPLAGALAGVEMRQGGPSGKPVYLHFAAVDHVAALLACDGILMALLARARVRTGGGQRVETSLLDAAALLNADAVAHCESSPAPQMPCSQYGPHALDRVYETAAGWISLVAETDQEWRALCRALGAEGLVDDARFASASARAENDETLSAILVDALKRRTAEAWLTALDEAGAPCAPVVADYEKSFHLDPQVIANDMVVEHEHASLGRVRLSHRWLRFSATPTRRPAPPPLLGERTREVLAEIGYAEAEIDALRERGVVAWEVAR